ncbi:MAG: HXXEE domain-containing protein [Lachnospiraceae bacterium]|nr:HXXEE domain-containing protein [Lachnospiraceae bacterium]
MAKRLDKWCDINWIIFLCATACAAAILSAIFWDKMPLGAKGGVFAAVIMAFHVLEEWKFPGGLHYFYNTLLGPKDPEKQELDRYPMSRMTDMVTNIGLQWIPLVYVLLSFVTGLSNAVAMCMIIFCFVEVFAHFGAGFMTLHMYKDAGKKTIYDPGFATACMMFLPAGIYLAVHLTGVTGRDWLWCIILFIIMILICIPLTETPLKKWVIKQEKGMFAFASPKYFEQFLDKK